jgi:hypothetical protein
MSRREVDNKQTGARQMRTEPTPAPRKWDQHIQDEGAKMREYTSATEVKPVITFNKPSPKQNTYLGKIS